MAVAQTALKDVFDAVGDACGLHGEAQCSVAVAQTPECTLWLFPVRHWATTTVISVTRISLGVGDDGRDWLLQRRLRRRWLRWSRWSCGWHVANGGWRGGVSRGWVGV